MARVAFPLVLQSPSSGSAIAGATATITLSDPGTSLGAGAGASIYIARAGGTPLPSNQIDSDDLGRWTQGPTAGYAQYWLEEGVYDIVVTKPGLTSFTITRELASASRPLITGTSGAFPAAGVLGRPGRQTDTGIWVVDTGTAWLARSLAATATASGSPSVLPGQILSCTGAGATPSLPPAPPDGTICGVRAGVAVTGSNPVTVNAAQQILVDGLAVNSFPLAQGAQWVGIFSTPQGQWVTLAGTRDTGWVPLTLPGALTNPDGTTPAARRIANRVWLDGTVVTTGAYAANAALATVQSGFGLLPASAKGLPIVPAGNAAPSPVPAFTVGAAGKISTPTPLAGLVQICFTGASYTLDD